MTPPPRWFSLRVLVFLAVWVCLDPFGVVAEVRLHPTFSDHAVLQRGMRVPVWGSADEGSTVVVEFAGRRRSTIARQGRWMVELPRMRASSMGRPLRVTGPHNSVEISDVVVGEVWLCSGQSNMEWPLRASHQPEADIAASTNPNLRLFTVTKRRSPEVETDLDHAPHGWELAGPEVVRNFSAVGYYFGRMLEASLRAEGVPVGIIHASWGGSPAEVWMRAGVLESDREYAADILAPAAETLARWEAAVREWEERRTAATARGESFRENRPGQPWRPAELYNGMLAGLIPYAIQGVIWYQGESNAGRAWQYRRLLADMIRNWRTDWGQGDFWFLQVQLAPWDRNRKRDLAEIASEVGESGWAELREAQNHVAATVPRVGVVVITDVGDKDDIHPTRKEPVGDRLARLALARVHGKPVVAVGPQLRSVRTRGGEVVLRFGDVGAGLRTLDGGAPAGFTVAGEDRKFHAASARISGRDEIIVSSPEVQRPVAARYGWADYPVVNLANEAGLPASPFRTDSWPGSTQRPAPSAR
ncbi:MAG: sialate O-acetylesterase [Verrucomicrobiae bacterium]|nr:sialate O-acetylesterase [Verrucomicrobiae bacterium]